MNATTSPLPASLLRSEVEDTSLDDRIRQAEQRLIAREENLRRTVNALGRRARASLTPSQLLKPVLLPAVGGLLALVGGWWVLRTRGGSGAVGHRAPAPGTGRAEGGKSRHEAPWISLVGLGWQLVPVAWRSRFNPQIVNLVITVGLPLAERVFSGFRAAAKPPPAIPTAGPIELARLAGSWYQAGALGSASGASRVQKRFKLTPRARGGFHLLERTPRADGSAQEVHGVVLPVRGSGGAKLRVSTWPAWLQWLPMAWHDEWVLHFDDDRGGEVLLGSPDGRALRLWSRRPGLRPERLRPLLDAAHDRGFDIDKIVFTDAA